MAANWPRLPSYTSPEELERPLPDGWRIERIENLYEQLPIGKRFDQKSSSPTGSIPVIDQSQAGIIGWHEEAPGIEASEERPVVTFANHTCEMRWMQRSFSVIQNVFPLVGRRGVCDTRFLYYGTKGRISLEGYKGHFPEFRNRWIVVPPASEQRAIGRILGSLDDKIELNRRMNRTLEAMARALFRSWFVDFDPVRAKDEGRAPAHMDAATAALFPDRFSENGLPEGWRWEPFTRHATVRKGLSYKGSGLCGEADGIPLHNLNSILEGGGYKYDGIKHYLGDHKDRHKIQPGDLIIANTEQGFDELLIGHSALVPATFGPKGLFSHHLYKLERVSRSPLSPEWFYLALSCSWIGERVRAFSNGTTVNMLPADAFELPVLPVPPAPVVDAMNRIVRPMFANQVAATGEARTLAALRDALLPKLMSGELRVREAERHLAEAV